MHLRNTNLIQGVLLTLTMHLRNTNLIQGVFTHIDHAFP